MPDRSKERSQKNIVKTVATMEAGRLLPGALVEDQLALR